MTFSVKERLRNSAVRLTFLGRIAQQKCIQRDRTSMQDPETDTTDRQCKMVTIHRSKPGAGPSLIGFRRN